MQKSATPSFPMARVKQAAPGRTAAWWNTCATLVLLWLGAALVLAEVLLIYFHPWGSVAGAGGDFQPFYTAAQAIRQGHDPYQARVSALQQGQQADANNGYDYQYPPPFALALVPLSLLPRLQWANNAQPITGWLVPETGAYLLGLAFLFGLLCSLLATRSRARLLPSGTIAAIV